MQVWDRNVPGEVPRKNEPASKWAEMKRYTRARLKRALVRARRHIPPGLRLVVGILLIGLGFLGFLPVLGFWMIPLGVAVAMLDIAPLWRWLRGR